MADGRQRIVLMIAATMLLTSADKLQGSANTIHQSAALNDDVCFLQLWQQPWPGASKGIATFGRSSPLRELNDQHIQEDQKSLDLGQPLAYELPQTQPLSVGSSDISDSNSLLGWPRQPISLLTGSAADSLGAEPLSFALSAPGLEPASSAVDVGDVQEDLSELMQLNKQLEEKLQQSNARLDLEMQGPTSQNTKLSSNSNVASAENAKQSETGAQREAAREVETHVQSSAHLLASDTEKIDRIVAAAVKTALVSIAAETKAVPAPTPAGDHDSADNAEGVTYVMIHYPFIILEVLLFVTCACCAVLGYIADYDKDDAFEFPWYLDPFINFSQCLIGTLMDPLTIIAGVLYLVFLNVYWFAQAKPALMQYADRVYLYLFLVFVAIGIIACVIRVVMHGISSAFGDIYLMDMLHGIKETMDNVKMLTVFTQGQYGRKFYSTLKSSGQFGKESLDKTKSIMRDSGAYAYDKFDDITDFIGITEASSEDEVTLKDMMTGNTGKNRTLTQAQKDKIEANRKAYAAKKEQKRGRTSERVRGYFSRASSAPSRPSA